MPEFLFPLLIFFAEVLHLTFGTIRVAFISRGLKLPAALFGFVEILVFLFALGQIFENLTNILNYVAFASGFATGTIVGLWIEEKLAVGEQSVTIFTNNDAREFISHLRKQHFGVTSVTARGLSGRIRLIVVLIKRRDLQKLRDIIEKYHPNAFISVQDVRLVSKNLYSLPLQTGTSPFIYLRRLFKR